MVVGSRSLDSTRTVPAALTQATSPSLWTVRLSHLNVSVDELLTMSRWRAAIASEPIASSGTSEPGHPDDVVVCEQRGRGGRVAVDGQSVEERVEGGKNFGLDHGSNRRGGRRRCVDAP